MTNCKHETYQKDCAICEDIASYCGYAMNEGFADFGEIDNREDWQDMRAYYEKWLDYEPDPDQEHDEKGLYD